MADIDIEGLEAVSNSALRGLKQSAAVSDKVLLRLAASGYVNKTMPITSSTTLLNMPTQSSSANPSVVASSVDTRLTRPELAKAAESAADARTTRPNTPHSRSSNSTLHSPSARQASANLSSSTNRPGTPKTARKGSVKRAAQSLVSTSRQHTPRSRFLNVGLEWNDQKLPQNFENHLRGDNNSINRPVTPSVNSSSPRGSYQDSTSSTQRIAFSPSRVDSLRGDARASARQDIIKGISIAKPSPPEIHNVSAHTALTDSRQLGHCTCVRCKDRIPIPDNYLNPRLKDKYTPPVQSEKMCQRYLSMRRIVSLQHSCHSLFRASSSHVLGPAFNAREAILQFNRSKSWSFGSETRRLEKGTGRGGEGIGFPLNSQPSFRCLRGRHLHRLHASHSQQPK
jgi:hypothetical protein